MLIPPPPPPPAPPGPVIRDRSHLVEKQLQHPVQVSVLCRRRSLGALLSEVDVEERHDGHQQPLVLHAGRMHLEEPGEAGVTEKKKRLIIGPTIKRILILRIIVENLENAFKIMK